MELLASVCLIFRNIKHDTARLDVLNGASLITMRSTNSRMNS